MYATQQGQTPKYKDIKSMQIHSMEGFQVKIQLDTKLSLKEPAIQCVTNTLYTIAREMVSFFFFPYSFSEAQNDLHIISTEHIPPASPLL